MEVISPFNFWDKELGTGYVRNEYLDRFEDYLKVPSTIVAVTGVRRSGKTYLCRQMIQRLMEKGTDPRSTIFINLEDPALEPYLGTQLLMDIHETYLHYLKQEGPIYFFIDEAQTINGWERWVRSMIEKYPEIKMIVTGSSSEILSQELSSLLTGRFMELRIQPFGFQEFLGFRGQLNKVWNEKEMQGRLLEYMEGGGYPQVQSIEDQGLKGEFLKELFHSIINRDIVNRFGVREVHKLKSLVTLLLNNISNLTSVTKMKNSMNSVGFKISSATVNEYFSYLSESLIFTFIPIISYKAKDIEQYPKKLYCIDTGMVRSVKSPKRMDLGSLAENIVAMELFRRFSKDEIFYWKGKGEVDFVIVRGDEKQLIQVCWDMEDPKTRKREIKALFEAEKELGKAKKMILSREGSKTEEGIEIVSLWKWLLN